jgi:cbb3-type cytochrome oxidase cytochrome c subunit
MRMTFRIILVGGLIVFFAVVAMVVFMPAMMKSPPTTVAHPYTEREAAGRKLYYSNGCLYCHSQYVRAQDTAMGPVSERGNYVYDQPVLFGSERTGPDLSYIGRKRSEQWEIDHLKDPREFSPLSLMPSYAFLTDDELGAIAEYLFGLGDRVAQERMIPPPPPYQGASDPHPAPTVAPAPAEGSHGWSTWLAAGLQRGKDLYTSRCQPCHGCAGNGLGSYAGTMSATPSDLTREPVRSMPPEEWFWHVSEGVPGTLMPSWVASLSDTERWSVIRYATAILARPVARDPDEGPPVGEYVGVTSPIASSYEVLEEGKAIYTRECMICHGTAGRGKGPYASRLEPAPPDFHDGSYGAFLQPTLNDADYYWRVSEGLPWSAMPGWKLHYSEDDRWRLIHFVRTFFTQTELFPSGSPESFSFPERYRTLRMPDGASFGRGRLTYARHCAGCHGLAGDGQGWRGGYVEPPPADFRVMAGKKITAEMEAEHLSKVTFGIPGTAMPPWGEFLTERERWDVVKFLLESFVKGRAPSTSAGDGRRVSAEFATAGIEEWTEGGHQTSAKRGNDLYGTYCATCHGDGGKGNGPGTAGNASGSPPALPSGMAPSYVAWRIWDGVPESVMYAFRPLLPEAAMWDLVSYVGALPAAQTARKTGGG